jgi:hypothetical protein
LQSSRAGWRRCSRSPRYEANLIARLMSLIRRPNSTRINDLRGDEPACRSGPRLTATGP